MLSELPRDFSSLPSIYFAVPGVGGTVWGVLSERDSKQKFPPFAQDTPVPPCRSKIWSYDFRDIDTFSFSAKIRDGH